MLYILQWGASQVVLVVKNLPANAGALRDTGSIPGSGRSPWGGYGNPLQYSCLENLHGQRNWRATVHTVANSWTRLKQTYYTCTCTIHPLAISLSSLTRQWVWKPEAGSHHPKLLVIRPSTYLLLSLSSVLCKHRGEKKTRAVSA